MNNPTLAPLTLLTYSATMKQYLCTGLIVVLSLVILPAFPQDLFDADGYYFPEEPIAISGFEVNFLNLETVSYYNNGKLDYEHPKNVAPNGLLLLVRSKDKRKLTYNFPKPTIRRDRVLLKSVATPIGMVTIEGEFLDDRGMFWNQASVIPMKTPVFRGTVSVVKDGKVVYEKVVRFVYWEGD